MADTNERRMVAMVEQLPIDVITIDDDIDGELDPKSDQNDSDYDSNDDDIEIIEVKQNCNNEFTMISDERYDRESHIPARDCKASDASVDTTSETLVDGDAKPLTTAVLARSEETAIETNAMPSVDNSVAIEGQSGAHDESKAINGSDSANTTNAHMSESDQTGVTPNKIRRVESPHTSTQQENSVSSSTSFAYVEHYEMYIKIFREKIKANDESKAEDLITKLNEVIEYLKKHRKSFVKSKQFVGLFRYGVEDMEKESDSDRIVKIHECLILELKRIKKGKQKSEKKLSKEEKAKNQKAVDRLSFQLIKLQKLIMKAENEELDYDAMESASSFTDLPKLLKRQLEIWKKREELLRRSTRTGRIMYKKFHYDRIGIPEIDKCAEDLFNKFVKKLENWSGSRYKDESLTFCDIHNAITKLIKEKGLTVSNVDHTIKQVFIDLRLEYRRRNLVETEDDWDSLEHLIDLKPNSLVSVDDPIVNIECAKNSSAYKRKLEELINKYAQKDKEKFGEELPFASVNEWDQSLQDNQDFESIDDKVGDLDDDDRDSEDKEEEVDENEDVSQQSSQDSVIEIVDIS